MLILALDLATRTGWALGALDDRAPRFGSIRFASVGASHEAVFAGALTWAAAFLKAERPERIVYEEPMRFRAGRSRQGNDEIAYGLAAITQAVAYLRGIYDVRKATARDVRLHFLGHNPKRAVAKKATVQRCRALGWEVVDDNEADACAIWSYQVALLAPERALRVTPLFSGHPSAAEELS